MTDRFAPAALMLAPLALLAACGQPATNEAAVANTAAVAEDPYYQRIMALNEAQQQAVFLRAILDAGQQQCQGVTASAPAERVNGRPAWTATCQDGSVWQLVLAPDGVMRVTGPTPASRPATAS